MGTIWNDIQKGVADAASFTAKKTTEFTELAKLKYKIHSEDGKLAKCFEEIGRLFYKAEREGGDRTAEISALIMQADKINADIDKYKAELARLKKSIVCSQCGSEISDECTFCPVCGCKFEEETEENTEE